MDRIKTSIRPASQISPAQTTQPCTAAERAGERSGASERLAAGPASASRSKQPACPAADRLLNRGCSAKGAPSTSQTRIDLRSINRRFDRHAPYGVRRGRHQAAVVQQTRSRKRGREHPDEALFLSLTRARAAAKLSRSSIALDITALRKFSTWLDEKHRAFANVRATFAGDHSSLTASCPPAY